ncbi:protein EXORDIUM-like 1 [Iris pallida]|uniref:Protein EXORDIUM-like 1 n=1 Tax=Iris pallida TaxID=29817 RepID=A0AAX6H2W2_IRIPA|nr:protein EXORDIUM-like 1 [Iris pallida]
MPGQSTTCACRSHRMTICSSCTTHRRIHEYTVEVRFGPRIDQIEGGRIRREVLPLSESSPVEVITLFSFRFVASLMLKFGVITMIGIAKIVAFR